MAVILTRTYPDIYTAAGIHSGLPYASAHDVPSAFAAMKQRSGVSVSRAQVADEALGAPVPAIVFHGDSDRVVNAHNGDIVIALPPTSTTTVGLPAAATWRINSS